MDANAASAVKLKCRTCLGEFEEVTMSALFEADEADVDAEDAGNEDLSEKFQFCCGIKIRNSHRLPSKVCSKCREFVHMWFRFRTMVLNSQVYLETCFSDGEQAEDFKQVSNSEFMKHMYQNLQVNCGLENQYQDDSPQEELDDITAQYQEILDGVNYVTDNEELVANEPVTDADDHPKEQAEEIMVVNVQPFDQDLVADETIKPVDDGQIVEDSPIVNEDYCDVDDFDDSNIDFLSPTPSPEPKPSTAQNKRRPGRPRKPDNELKCKRKNTNPGEPETEFKRLPTKFICSLCGNVYHKKSIFTSHMMAHADYKPHQCEICDKSFRQMGELRAHIRRHTGERPYKCMYCERHFYDRSERVRHERVHTNTRPYECKECGKAFTHPAILKNHSLVHSGEKNYNCAVCSKSFTLMHQLKAHQQTIIHRNMEEQAMANSTDYTD
ncbi:zinc finger and SCAN domain-containing protein 31 [Drosophila persimilis]|uniref:zinc finger and SCAN domain-containing protein 31 n=1 Tax=Drosophila persimilis TaxID=7234 RepID=UPI000F09492E|nr:zinc finger and SCAN domain-containing protein 31 [Drosophila persimilis]